MPKPVYLDYAATTPVDPRVAQAMAQCLTLEGNFANAASRSHVFGWRAEEAVEQGRRQLADLIGADPREIVWTSGATESDNLAIKGIAHCHRERGRHLITSSIEHKAVLDSCGQLASEGFSVTYLPPTAGGVVEASAVEAALRPDTILVSLMHVNNELGSLNDIVAIGEICRRRGVYFHVDAAQSVGKIPLDVARLPVDLMSFSAHKMYGPKGIGALFVRRQPRVLLTPQMHGGGHERGMRSGTLPVHQIVGFGEAAGIASGEMAEEGARIEQLRQRFWARVGRIPGVALNVAPPSRLPGILNLRFEGVEGEALMMALPDLALSSGSACSSASLEPSYVLRALGLCDEWAHSSLRVSIGRFTRPEDVDVAASRFEEVVPPLRA